jgi:hypothetical protein
MSSTSSTLNNFGSANWIVQVGLDQGLTLKTTKFKMPGVNAGVTGIGNRTEFVLQASGDHVQYDNLEIDFLLDENLANYIKLYKWMRDNVKRGIEETASINIHFLGNDKKFQGVDVEFYEAFPISLDSFELDSDGHDTDVVCTVTFAYTGFDFVDQTDRDADIDLSRFE